MLWYFIINLIIFFIALKISYLVFGQKMYFPFRIAEISGAIITNLITILVMLLFFNFKILFTILFINSLLSYSTYHVINMIQTSPRTKSLLDLYNYKKINLPDYKNIYSLENILDNRLERFKTSKQIKIKDEKIYYDENTNNFLKLLLFIFIIIKKI